MKVHLRQIPEGGTLHLEGEEDARFLDLEQASAQAVSSLSYCLDAGVSEGGVFATGRLEVRVRTACVACLEPFEIDVIVPDFATRNELEGRELVDLGPEVREDIHLALPAHPRCDVQGRKACPASFPPARADAPEPAGNAAWGALDKLQTKNIKSN